MNDTLLIAEQFYSQQSEGISTGFPAYFIRLAKCNLLCGGANGKLVKENKATWFCDTIPVWKKGKNINFEGIISSIQDACNWDWVKDGRIHIIISGGEPTMDIHQQSIIDFINLLNFENPNAHFFFEIETNGTNKFKPELFDNINQINCSPKLANSGMAKDKRITPAAIKQVMMHINYQFKFVISQERDLEEIMKDFIDPFSIPWQKIILMPGVDCLADLSERTRMCFELGKKWGYRAITRSHVLAWDKTTGV